MLTLLLLKRINYIEVSLFNYLSEKRLLRSSRLTKDREDDERRGIKDYLSRLLMELS